MFFKTLIEENGLYFLKNVNLNMQSKFQAQYLDNLLYTRQDSRARLNLNPSSITKSLSSLKEAGAGGGEGVGCTAGVCVRIKQDNIHKMLRSMSDKIKH